MKNFINTLICNLALISSLGVWACGVFLTNLFLKQSTTLSCVILTISTCAAALLLHLAFIKINDKPQTVKVKKN